MQTAGMPETPHRGSALRHRAPFGTGRTGLANPIIGAAGWTADIWLLFRCDDPARAAANHCNRRLVAAAAAAGFAAAIIDPARIDFADTAPTGPHEVANVDAHCAPDAADAPDAPDARDARDARDASRHRGVVVAMDGRAVPLPRMVLQRSGARLGGRGHALMDRLASLGAATAATPGASAIASDKLKSARVLAAAGLPAPTTVALRAGEAPDALRLARKVGFPLVLKARRGTRGSEVRICPDPAALREGIANLAGAGPLVAQRYVPRSHGRDMRILVIDGRPVAAMERVACGDDFRANVALGAEPRAIHPPIEAVDLALRAAGALGLGIAGVDLLYDRAGFSVCEVNTAPGFERLEAVTGVDVAGAMIAHLARRAGVAGETGNE